MKLDRDRALDAALLACVVVLAIPRAMLLGEAFYERDLAFDWATLVDMWVGSVARGSWPLWDSSVSFGEPLLATPDAQVLYPPSWLNLVLRPWTYYRWFAAGHLLLAGVATAALSRRLGASRAAALCSGALYLASGPLLSLLNVYHHFAGACWMPCVAWAAERWLETRKPMHLVTWIVATAAQLLAGSADYVVVTLVLTSALVLARAERSLTRESRRLLAIATGVLALAAAVAAVQWIPAAELVWRSERWRMPDVMRTRWAVPPLMLGQVVVPALLDDLDLAPRAQALLQPGGPAFLRSLYLGLPALLLAIAGASAATRPRRAVTVVGLLALLFALGEATPFYGLATTVVPVLRVFRYPSKAMPLVALCVALLAGAGVDGWGWWGGRRRWFVSGLLVATTAGLAVLAVAAGRGMTEPLLAAGADTAPLRALAGQLAAAALASVLTLIALGRSGRTAALVAVAAVLVPAAGVNLTTPRRLLEITPPVLETLGAAGSGRPRLHVYDYLGEASTRYLHRAEPYPLLAPPGLALREAQVLSQRLYPFPPSAGRWGFDGAFDTDFRGLYPPFLRELTGLVDSVQGTPLHTWLLRLGAVDAVVSLHDQPAPGLEPIGWRPTLFPEPARAWRVPDPRPRVYFVAGARPGGDAPSLVAASRDMEVGREVMIEGLPRRVAPPSGDAGRVARADVRPDRIEVEVDASEPGWLVVVDTWDPGWRARVDGGAAELLRANVAFRAVAVPAGHHAVSLAYRPAGLSLGLVVSALGLAVLVALAWRARR